MKVLIAVDDQTHEAVTVAKQLFPNADHTIVSATDVDRLLFAEPYTGGIVSPALSDEVLKAAESRATDAVEAAKDIVGSDAEIQVKIGEAGSVICQQAVLLGADVIVVGRRSHSWLSRVFDQPVSDYVVRHAPCPVLVVNEPSKPT